jgi:hypothetical protein
MIHSTEIFNWWHICYERISVMAEKDDLDKEETFFSGSFASMHPLPLFRTSRCLSRSASSTDFNS